MKFLGTLFLGLALTLLGGSESMAAVVRFAGTISNYTPIVGSNNPINLLGQTFAINADIDNAGNVTSGFIRFSGIPGNHFTVPFTGPNGSSAIAPFALNNIPTTSGTLSLSIAQNIPDFSPASLNQLKGFSGAMTLAGVFGANVGVYSGSITAVPEPGSMLALGGLVAACGVFQYRRSRKAAK